MKNRIAKLLKRCAVAGALIGLCLGTPAPAGASQPPARFIGSDPLLALFQNIYWRWYYGEITIPVDSNGNAVVGPVVLMAVPNTPGDGTPGSLDITLKADQPFMLPLWNLLGNEYADGSTDPLINLNVFRTLDLTLTLDGVPLVDHSNLMRHFSQFSFIPPIPYNFPPAVSFIWLQGIGELHGPLSPGHHVLRLDAKNTDTVDLFGLVFEFHNTWHLTVQPGDNRSE